MMRAGTLYNDTDPYCAQWLRNLIAAGHIAEGDVDDRDIRDLDADDVSRYRRCHFFAGIAGWDHALALAGWPAARPVWTGSCPCQPFSNAGRQGGSADARHLWPQWLRLIRQCRPDTIFGEQVAGAVGFGWIDRVFADLEAEGYACGAAVLGAHSVGAPHIRQRLFWVADAVSERVRGQAGNNRRTSSPVCDEIREQRVWADCGTSGATGGLAEPAEPGRRSQPQRHAGADGRAPQEPRRLCGTGRLALTECDRPQGHVGAELLGIPERQHQSPGRSGWDDAEWLPCLDGKARRTQPGLHPLAPRLPGDVGRLRAYGNAIVPQAAAQFIAAFMQTPYGAAA